MLVNDSLISLLSCVIHQVFSGSCGRIFVNIMMSFTWAGILLCSSIHSVFTSMWILSFLFLDKKINILRAMHHKIEALRECVCKTATVWLVCVCVFVFIFTLCSSWDGRQGPVKDVYSLANNPQYKLEVQCPTGGAAVWVLLTRHITDKVETVMEQKDLF